MLSPISVIPSELLSKIIVFTISSDNAVTTNNPRFAIARVSRHWRAVVLQTPEIWSQLLIHAEPTDSVSIINAKISLAKLWLERSGTSALSVSLLDYSENPTPIDFIRPYTARLRKLSIDGGDSRAFVNEILCREDFSMLVELRVHGTLGGSYRPNRHFSAPKLKRVAIFHCLTFSEREFYSPSNQLTHLLLAIPIAYNVWRHILKECSIHLECGAFMTYEVDGDIYEPVVLRGLTSLIIQEPGRNNDRYFQGVQCPSLRSLYINTTMGILKSYHTLPIISSVRRLAMSLHHDPAITPTVLGKGEYERFFKAAPFVEKLILSLSQGGASYIPVFDALAPAASHDVCPRLTSLVIMEHNGWICDIFPMDNFVDLLESRWTNRPLVSEAHQETCSLSHVQVHYQNIKTKATRPILKRLRREGMQVEVKSARSSLTWNDWLQLEIDQMDWIRGTNVGGRRYLGDLYKAMV